MRTSKESYVPNRIHFNKTKKEASFDKNLLLFYNLAPIYSPDNASAKPAYECLRE